MIPRIIHQIWIGEINTPPLALMETWERCAKNIGAEYILWNESEIRKRRIVFDCEKTMEKISEINGKADVMRWEILLLYGGIFVDADSICVEQLIDDFFTLSQLTTHDKGFAAFENETARPNLVATGTMGFTPNHPLVADIVELLKAPQNTVELRIKKAWITVGPGCITRFLETGKYRETVVVFPSHYFIPIHYTAETPKYTGHQKVYAHQLWGTGEQRYGKAEMSAKIPDELLPIVVPAVSILVNSYNTPIKWIHDCLLSIQHQIGNFAMELVWIDDGSTPPFADSLKGELEWFKRTTRFLTDVKYHRMETNVGTRVAIDYGLGLCSHELVIKMDSDDMMISTRIQRQIEYMEENPQVVCCGGQLVQFVEDDGGQIIARGRTNHPLVIGQEHCERWGWFMNHPTLCYRKWAVLEVGGYGVGKSLGEDRELEVKLWHYWGDGSVCNMVDCLVLYRIHPGQLSYGT